MTAGQRWRNEKPTEAGWYWWRDPAFVLSGGTTVDYFSEKDLQFDYGPNCGHQRQGMT